MTFGARSGQIGWEVSNNKKVMVTKAIYETKDKQLIPLDDIQHINARPNEAIKKGYESLTVIYKDGMKVTLSLSEYEPLKKAWEVRRNGYNK